MHPISIVISYCSVDKRFIKKNIENCLKLTDDVILVFCTHLLNGDKEDLIDIVNLLKEYPSLRYECVAFNRHENSKYHHNMFRWQGKEIAKYDRVLFIDADEFFNVDTFNKYLEEKSYLNYDVVCFKCYWYFRDAVNRAVQREQCGTLYNKKVLTPEVIFNYYERWFFLKNFNPNSTLSYKENVTFNDEIFFHHFSWVRTKEEMLKKVSSWAHKDYEPGKDITKMVEEEFSNEFDGTDFVHGYQYEKVENIFNI